MAVCLLGGYAWLAVGGIAWAATSLGLPARDVALHALGLGFVVSMMMGHAPVILPAIARVKLLFGFFFYLPLAALHLSLLARFGLGWADPAWRAQGSLFNALSIALFAATAVGAALAWRHRYGARRTEGTVMNSIFRIEEPAPRVPPRGFALWALGFRPFYLLASIFAALSIGLWALQFSGVLGSPYLQGPLWHAHEMLFGFALAVIVGFLFTAGRNWSNRPTPTGAKLAALALLWVAGRVLVLTPFGWAAALVNAAFPLAAAIALAVPFIASGNKRNYFFVALLLLMSLATLAVHLDHLEVLALPGWLGIQVALDVVLFIIAVMGGRVIPMFTNNGVAGANAARQPLVEKAALGSLLALLAAGALQLPTVAIAILAGLAAAAHLVRWLLWKPWKTWRVPLVWVLARRLCLDPRPSAAARAGRHRLGRAVGGGACTDGGRDRRDDHRDDDPHRAWPHRPAAQGGSAGTWPATCWCWPPRWCAWWFRWRFRNGRSRRSWCPQGCGPAASRCMRRATGKC